MTRCWRCGYPCQVCPESNIVGICCMCGADLEEPFRKNELNDLLNKSEDKDTD